MTNKPTLYALPQTTVEVDGDSYLIEAMAATDAVDIQQFLIENEMKMDSKLMKKLICGKVSKNGTMIDHKNFDFVFTKKTVLLRKLVEEVLAWNYEDASDFLEENATQE